MTFFSTLYPYSRRKERHQTLYNALGSTATNLKTSSERWVANIASRTLRHNELHFAQVSYTMALNHAIGPKTTRATEVQTMRSNSAPGHIYSVDVETVSSKIFVFHSQLSFDCIFQQTNADIPYADHFYVSTHYCIVKVGYSPFLTPFLNQLCDEGWRRRKPVDSALRHQVQEDALGPRKVFH